MQKTGLFSVLLGLAVVCASPAPDALAQRGGDGRGDWGGRGERGDRGGREERGREDRGREDRGRGNRGGEERGRGDRGREERGREQGRGRGEDNRSSEDRRREFMQRLDRNGDGKVEASELDERWRGWYEGEMKKAGLDPSKAISTEQFIRARAGQDLQQQRAENPTAFLAPLPPEPVPGFDTLLSPDELVMLDPEKKRPFVMPVAAPTQAAKTEERREDRGGWGGRGGRGGGERGGGERGGGGWGGGERGGGERGGWGGRGGPGGGPERGREESRESRSSDQGSGDRAQEYVKSLMDKYDKDKNSIIEGDEFKSMTNADRSDLNKDGRITLDELMQRVRGEGDSGSSRQGRSPGKGEDKSGRNSYRFTSALERIEGSARSWVERYDDNGDGQVSMAEFSTSWTDSKVREFQGYDKNGDGIVTGAEYSGGRDEGRGERRGR